MWGEGCKGLKMIYSLLLIVFESMESSLNTKTSLNQSSFISKPEET